MFALFPPADRCGTTLTRRLHPIHHSLSETAEHGDASAHQSVFTFTIILLSLPQSLFYIITQNPTKNCPYIFLFCQSYHGDANFPFILQTYVMAAALCIHTAITLSYIFPECCVLETICWCSRHVHTGLCWRAGIWIVIWIDGSESEQLSESAACLLLRSGSAWHVFHLHSSRLRESLLDIWILMETFTSHWHRKLECGGLCRPHEQPVSLQVCLFIKRVFQPRLGRYGV